MKAVSPLGSAVAAGLALCIAIAPAPAAAAGKTYVVTIANMKFRGVPAAVRAGDTIVWLNRDIFRHTATARNGSFNLDLPAGAKGRTQVRGSGQIAFYCRFHPGMTGKLQVIK